MLCNYAPQINNIGDLTPMPATGPTYIQREYISFDDLDLRVPDFNDTRTLVLKRVTNRTLCNFFNMRRDQDWEQHELISLSIGGLARETIVEFQNFVLTNLGKPFTYIDYNSQEYTVIVTNPEAVVTYNDNCRDILTVEMYVL